MKKTISINISGFVFNIEEEAYDQLRQYLKNIRKNFNNEDEREEIMADIEARIAELFQERISPIKEVIDEKDIEDIATIMGNPEDFSTDEESDNTSEERKYESTTDEQPPKRLFRDKDNASIGGVCAGLSHYLNLDIFVVRLLFVVLTLTIGSGILLYIILLIVIPEAKTTADKIQMKGQSVNLENIKTHVNNIKDSIADTTRKSNVKKKVETTVDAGVKASRSILHIIAKIIGIVFLLGGIFFLSISTFILLGNFDIIPFFNENSIDSLPLLIKLVFPDSTSIPLMLITILVTAVIPAIIAIAVGARIVFNLKHKLKIFILTLITIWCVAITILFFKGVGLATQFSHHEEMKYDIPVTIDSTNTLFIDVIDDDMFSKRFHDNHLWTASDIIKLDEENMYIGLPRLNVIQTIDSEDIQVTLYKRSNGSSKINAIENAENINYEIQTENNVLNLASYYTISREDKIRMQQPKIEIKVPYGKKVKFGKNIDALINRIEGVDDYWEDELRNTQWVSKLNGFFCDYCPGSVYQYDNE